MSAPDARADRPESPDRSAELRIRPAERRDADAIAAIYGPLVRETAISFELEAPGAHEVAKRIERTRRTLPWLVAVGASGRVLGYASASPYRERAAYRWSVEVSVYVDRAARGRGVGRRLYRALHGILRAQGYRVTYAVIALPNPASVRLHETMSYERIGVFRGAGYKLGRWHDVLWMRREIADLDTEPAGPVPFRDLDAATVRRILG